MSGIETESGSSRTRAFLYDIARSYSRRAVYNELETDAGKIKKRVTAEIDPFERRMYAAYVFRYVGAIAAILLTALWLYGAAPLVPAFQDDGGLAWLKYAIAIAIPLLGLIILWIVRAWLDQRFEVLQERMQVVIGDILASLALSTEQYHSAFRQTDDARQSAEALLDLMSQRVRNVLYYQEIYYIPVIMKIELTEWRLKMRSYMGIPILIAVFLYAGFLLGVCSVDGAICNFQTGAASPDVFDEIRAYYLAFIPGSNPVDDAVFTIAIVLSTGIFILANRIGDAILDMIEEVLNLENHPSVDTKMILAGHRRASYMPASEAERGEHTHLHESTHDMSAFIVDHYYSILQRFLAWSTSPYSTRPQDPRDPRNRPTDPDDPSGT